MSELDKNFQETIFNTLATLLAQNKFDTDTQLDIYLAMKKAALDMQESKADLIRAKIAEWDSMYGEADNSLYTLGLRHALDIITNEVATERNGYDGEKYQKEETDGFSI
jgi:hypothetical protein